MFVIEYAMKKYQTKARQWYIVRVEISMLQLRASDNRSKSSFSLKVLSHCSWETAGQEGLLQNWLRTRCHFALVERNNRGAVNFASVSFPFHCTDRLGEQEGEEEAYSPDLNALLKISKD